MPDDPTLGELGRSTNRIERTLNDLASNVNGWREDVIELRKETAENTKDIAAIQADQKAEKARNDNRRWLIYLAVIAAGLAFLSQLYFARGFGP